jgi:osmotically-inducible protein OsmY
MLEVSGIAAAPVRAAPLEEVVVTARKRVEPLTDEQVTRQVEKALDDDPYLYAEHITVTTKNGVVRLEGIVGDAGELIRVMRISRKAPGAKRVLDDLEIQASFPD